MINRRSSLLWGAALLLAAFLILAYRNYTQDDVFITYAYSRNLIDGQGFVFNAGERVQGTTTPLWTLVMAGVHLLKPDILLAGNLLSGAFILLTAVLLTLVLRGHVSRGIVALSVLCFTVSRLPYVSLGMETMLYCALLMGGLLLWQRGHRHWALFTAGLLIWTRADGMVLAGVFGLLLLADVLAAPSARSVRRLVTGAGVVALTIAPWFVFAVLYFGAPLPNTFSAKTYAFRGLAFVEKMPEFLDFLAVSPVIGAITCALIAIGLPVALRQAALRPLALWVICYILGYTVLNTFEFWYYTPLQTGLIALAAVGAEALRRRVIGASPVVQRLALAAAAVFMLMFVVTGLERTLGMSAGPNRTAVYRQIGEWVNNVTPPDSTLLVSDLGIIGYHARRHAVDTFGLIVPQMHFRHGEYAALKYRPDYVATIRYGWEPVEAMPEFRQAYRPVFLIPVPDEPAFSPSGIYVRRTPLTTPERVHQGELFSLNCAIDTPRGELLPTLTHVTLSVGSQPVVSVAQPFMSGVYPPQMGGRARGDESIREQVILPSGALATGRYDWQIDCGDGPLTGVLDIAPLAESPRYTPNPAAWSDGVALTGYVIDAETIYAGGAIPLMLEWRVSPQQGPFWAGVELWDAAGNKAAEGILTLPDLLADAPLPETIVTTGDILLPVALPAGEYTVHLNRYDIDADVLVPLDAGGVTLTLPKPITVQPWSPHG